MYDRILIPLDGSALAEAAVPVARLIPSRLVYLLNVEPDEPVITHEFDATGHEVRRRTLFHTDAEHLTPIAESFRAYHGDQDLMSSLLAVPGHSPKRDKIAEHVIRDSA